MPRELTDQIATALPSAAAVFAAKGIDATRMDDIASATGIPRATLYYHFGSKEDILAWLLERLLRTVSNDVGVVMDQPGTSRERLARIIETHLGIYAENPGLCRVLLAELGRVTKIPALAEAIWTGFHEPVRKLLDAGCQDGTLREVDPEPTASALFGAITMLGLHYIVTDQVLDVPKVAAQLDNLVIAGLAGHATPS